MTDDRAKLVISQMRDYLRELAQDPELHEVGKIDAIASFFDHELKVRAVIEEHADTGDKPEPPMVVLTPGEPAPWADLSLNCPICGEGPLPLRDSDPPGLTYISHCGQSWLRGQPNFLE